MTGGAWHKLAFYSSVTLLNIGAMVTVGLAYVLPALEPRPVAAAMPPVVSKLQSAPVPPATLQGTPVRAVVPTVGIDLPVQNGAYNPTTGAWTLGHTSAFYAMTTVPVNDTGGTTLIYGHNVWGIFRGLHALSPGDALLVYTKNGLVFRYTYKTVQQVTPENTSLLHRGGPPAVILQTCSGVWSQYRKLFLFQLVSVEKYD